MAKTPKAEPEAPAVPTVTVRLAHRCFIRGSVGGPGDLVRMPEAEAKRRCSDPKFGRIETAAARGRGPIETAATRTGAPAGRGVPKGERVPDDADAGDED